MAPVTPSKIKRGDIWIADLDPGFGTEMRKKRPVLVISNNTLNTYWPKVIVIPLTTKVYYTGPERVVLGKGMGIDQDSIALPSEVRSIDKSRLVKRAGKIIERKMTEIEDALMLVLGIRELD